MYTVDIKLFCAGWTICWRRSAARNEKHRVRPKSREDGENLGEIIFALTREIISGSLRFCLLKGGTTACAILTPLLMYYTTRIRNKTLNRILSNDNEVNQQYTKIWFVLSLFLRCDTIPTSSLLLPHLPITRSPHIGRSHLRSMVPHAFLSCFRCISTRQFAYHLEPV